MSTYHADKPWSTNQDVDCHCDLDLSWMNRKINRDHLHSDTHVSSKLDKRRSILCLIIIWTRFGWLVDWLVVLGFNSTLTTKVVIPCRSVTHNYVFPGFLKSVLTQLFFPNPSTTFLTCFCRGERRKYAGKKFRLNQVSNSETQV